MPTQCFEETVNFSRFPGSRNLNTICRPISCNRVSAGGKGVVTAGTNWPGTTHAHAHAQSTSLCLALTSIKALRYPAVSLVIWQAPHFMSRVNLDPPPRLTFLSRTPLSWTACPLTPFKARSRHSSWSSHCYDFQSSCSWKSSHSWTPQSTCSPPSAPHR